MRIWGRTTDQITKVKTWVKVETTADNRNDAVYLVWLIQVLKLNYGESPFFGDWGIPAAASVAQQIPPDFYMNLTQKRFAKYFASLILTKQPSPINNPTPVYQIIGLTKAGVRLDQLFPSGQVPE